MKILMVCLGNICRSPLAEGIMKTKIKEHQLDWEVDSAGTSGWHIGETPDPRSIRVAQKNEIDIIDQRARRFSVEDFDYFDLILVMDSSNYRDVMRLAQNKAQKEKIKMIMNVVQSGYNQNVPDPYWENDGFENVFNMLEAACEKLVEKYK